tara:strand:- start:4344 stop:4634 length:291 start_codon:yes stop_codon:yes gene_type:complete
MKALTMLIFIILIAVAIAHFSPNIYDKGREWSSNKVGELTTNSIGSTMDSLLDLTSFSCNTNKDCEDKYKINNLKCVNSKCTVEVKQNGTSTNSTQ